MTTITEENRVRHDPGLTWRQKLSRIDVKTAPYVYIAPFFLLFALIGLFPLLYTAYVSFRDYSLIRGDLGPTGLDNYTFVVSQPRFWQALRNTFSIFLLSSVPQLVVAVALAAVLNVNLRAKTFFRMGVLLPYVVAPVAVALIFGQLFADQSGTVNALLAALNLPPVGWHSDTLASHIAIATMVNFRWTGYNTLIFLAAMQAIPADVIEAAVVDGASRWQTFWHITLPLLRPTVIFIAVTSTIGGLQIFDEPRLFGGADAPGGSDRQFMTVTMYLYELGWGPQHDLGRASAVAWLLFAVIVVFSLLSLFLTTRLASSGTTPAKKVHR